MQHEKVDQWRKITPLIAKNYNVVLPFDGELIMVNPEDLIVDASYQRNPSKRSLRLIYRTIEEWSWSAFKPPICTRVGGMLHVLDGQHTSIAAASHPYIERIPVFVVRGELDLRSRADAFVRQNTDRTEVTPVVKFKAQLEAGDSLATGINMALRAASVTLADSISVRRFALTDARSSTAAISTLRALYKKIGLVKLTETLKVCVNSGIGHIPQYHLIAVSDLLHGKLYAGKYNGDQLAEAVRNYPPAEFQGDVVRKARDLGIANQKAATLLLSERYRELDT